MMILAGAEDCLLQFLILVGGHILGDSSDRAVQDPAQIIKGGSSHGFIFSQFINRGTGNMMPVD